MKPNWTTTQKGRLPLGKGNPPTIWQKYVLSMLDLLKMNLENTEPQEGSFEGKLSVILGWGNWKVLGTFPWSPLTFIKGSELHMKIAGLFLSVCRLWCWISYGLRTESILCHLKATLVLISQACVDVYGIKVVCRRNQLTTVQYCNANCWWLQLMV